MNLRDKPEVLAPAGTLEIAMAVIDAGADAVYLGGKRFNMRQHRSSFNLTDEEVGQAIRYAHERGKRIYYTLNIGYAWPRRDLTADVPVDRDRRTVPGLPHRSPSCDPQERLSALSQRAGLDRTAGQFPARPRQ